jgi:histidine phosphotransferase ChpT
VTAQGAAQGADLSALVSARLCHDLISPMGAIGNGLELMQLSQLTTSAEVELIAGSLGSAIAKLRFFRIAFGPVEAQARLAGDEIRAVADAMFPGRFTVSWTGAPAEIDRATGKLVCLALLCLEKSLPMGGTAAICVEGEAIEITAQGRRLAPPADLWALAAGATPGPLRSDGVQFALLGAALAALGMDIETSFDEVRGEVRIARPRLA